MKHFLSLSKTMVLPTLLFGCIFLATKGHPQSSVNSDTKTINYVVSGLDALEFEGLFKLNADELAKMGATREKVTVKPGYPCVISLEDAEVGEEVILMPYEHISSNSPYQSKGPVFVRQNVSKATYHNSIPENLKQRTLSIRVYDDEDLMVNARTIDGTALEEFIQEAFQNPAAKYIQVHISSPGCFNCQVDRQ